MRNKIDYGIDLGTTNSAIARIENGEPIIKKSDTLKDTIPSCIHFNRRQDVLAGDMAFNVMKNEKIKALKTFERGNQNTFIEFKRTMGTTHTNECFNMKKAFTSEELSAEVLKKLRSFVDENITSIVITVPAKFQYPQKEATMQAARMAGFKNIQLLQEPVAAATAYGLQTKNKDGYWLVFDFGGGTFDAALIKAEEGILTVKDTEGDNWLGGKDIDEAIVDQIIIPNIQQNFSIESILNDRGKRQILREALKFLAEDAKIQMSFKDSYHILTELDDLRFNDDNGDEPEIDVLVTQKDMQEVVEPIFQKAIDITKELLKRNNLKGSDLVALILVGGPTYSPILRRMLKEQITDKVDTSVDPMTVVAKGAALFASTISVSDEVKDASRDGTKLQLDIKYEAATVELDEMVNIKILKDKTIGIFPEKIYADIVRSDGAWASGKKLVGERATLIDVQLIEGRSNSFEINVYDEVGNKLHCQPNQFSILQGVGGLDSMQILPYHIGIGRFYQSEEKELFYPVKGLEKNKRVPATGVAYGLRTRNTIRPGMVKDIIRVPIYQGEYNAEGTKPVLNNLINEVVISGETLPALLPEGSPVEITIKVDRSELMTFIAYFPTIEHTEELKIEVNQAKPPTQDTLKREIVKAKQIAKQVNATELVENLNALEKQLENEGGSDDGKLKILDGLRKELLKLDSAEKVAEWPKIEEELKKAFYELEELIEKIKRNRDDDEFDMEKIEAHLQEFRSSIAQTIKDKSKKEAKDLIRAIGQLHFELITLVTAGENLTRHLNHFDTHFETYHWKNPAKARQLLNQAKQLVAAGKSGSIRPILAQVVDLMPEDGKETLQ